MTFTTVFAPSISRTRELSVSVSLDDFKPEVIAEYLRGQGFQVDGTFSRGLMEEMDRVRTQRRTWLGPEDEDIFEDGLWLTEAELSRIDTLAMCGQREAAIQSLIGLVRAFKPGSHL